MEFKNFKRLITVVVLGISFLDATISLADCVYDAKQKTSFVILDNHTILLRGNYGDDILIKTYSFINRNPEITILKDSFCSYESAVLYVDGEVVDANNVTRIRK